MRNLKLIGSLILILFAAYNLTIQFESRFRILYTALLILLIIILSIGGLIGWYLIKTRPRRKVEPGFEYIYVEDDGSARELDNDEQEYLNTKFYGGTEIDLT